MERYKPSCENKINRIGGHIANELLNKYWPIKEQLMNKDSSLRVLIIREIYELSVKKES